MESSNILAINGQDDPWHLLGLLPLTDPTNQEDDDEGKPMRVLIPGAWHCADTNPPAPSDPPELSKARARVKQQVHAWLIQTPASTPTLSPTLVNSPTANGRTNNFVGILGQSSTLSPVDQTILFAFIICVLAGLLFLFTTFTIRRLRLWGKTGIQDEGDMKGAVSSTLHDQRNQIRSHMVLPLSSEQEVKTRVIHSDHNTVNTTFTKQANPALDA